MPRVSTQSTRYGLWTLQDRGSLTYRPYKYTLNLRLIKTHGDFLKLVAHVLEKQFPWTDNALADMIKGVEDYTNLEFSGSLYAEVS